MVGADRSLPTGLESFAGDAFGGSTGPASALLSSLAERCRAGEVGDEELYRALDRVLFEDQLYRLNSAPPEGMGAYAISHRRQQLQARIRSLTSGTPDPE